MNSIIDSFNAALSINRNHSSYISPIAASYGHGLLENYIRAKLTQH